MKIYILIFTLIGSMIYSTQGFSKDWSQVPLCSADQPACVTGLSTLQPINLENGKIVFDFDTDGCLASAPVQKQGENYYPNNGLSTSGTLEGQCSYRDQLSKANIIYKEKCTTYQNSIYYGRIFALYTVKDKAVNGNLDFIGHRHDLEHAVVWMKDGKVTHIGVSAHGELTNTAANLSPLAKEYGNNTYAVVYHKNGVLTHALRLAASKTSNNIQVVNETPENPTGKWVLPNVIDIDQAPTNYINTLFSSDYGKATLEIKPSRLINFLNSKKPAEWNNVTFY